MAKANRRQPEHVIVGVDGSANARAAVRWAVEHAVDGDTVTLAYVWQHPPRAADPQLTALADDAAPRAVLQRERAKAAQLPGAAGVKLDSNLEHGDPGICLERAGGDLLVVGARGHSGIAGLLLGSVSMHLAKRARCPVVIVPHPVPPMP